MITALPLKLRLTVDNNELNERVRDHNSYWFPWYVSLSRDTLELTNIFYDALHAADAVRTTGAFTRELQQTIELADEFLEEVAARNYTLVRKSDRSQLYSMRDKHAVMKLQIEAIRRVAMPTLTSFPPSCELDDQLTYFLEESCDEMLSGARVYPLQDSDLAELEQVYDSLDDKYSCDRDLMLQTIRDYRDIGFEDSSEVIDKAPQEAKRLHAELMTNYPHLIEYLINSPALQERFSKQVIRDGLSLEIFFEHPYVADFLRKAESLEKGVRAAGDEIVIQDKHSLPAIRFQGGLRPIRELPGYPNTFRNLAGWHTVGLDYRSKHCGLNEAKGRDFSLSANGYTYTKHEGLVPFNPRTWNWIRDRQVIPVDLNQPEWWKQLPIYKTEWLTKESDDDSGWRIEWLASRTQDGPQLVYAHAFRCVIVPTGKVDDQGRIEAAYYPFGQYAYLFGGVGRALEPMRKEVHYPDRVLQSDRERNIVWYQQRITAEQGLKAFAYIRQERIETQLEADGLKPPSFRLNDKNCACADRETAQAIGLDLPLALPAETTKSVGLWLAANVLRWVPPVRWVTFWWMSVPQDWDLISANSYTLAIYLLLRRKTDTHHLGATTLNASRKPLLESVSW